MIDTATISPMMAFDTVTPALYNEADVGRIAAAAAEQAVGKLLNRIPSGTAMLDNSINTSTSSIQQNCGGSEMSDRLKAKVTVNGKTQWVCGESVQKLVDNAISLSKVPVIKESISFGKYAKDYMALYKNNGSVEGNTLVGYRSYMSNHILPFFGDMLIDQITPDHIQQYINSKAQTYTQKTIKEHLNLIRPIFDSAVEDGLIVKNPCVSKRIKIIGKKSKKVLSYTEEEFKQLERLLTLLSGPSKLFLALSIYTGMRQGELFGLQWENIDLGTNTLQVTQAVAWPSQNQGIIKSPKTANGIRTIIIIPQLSNVLKEYQQSSGYVLTTANQKNDKPMTHQAVKCLKQKIQDAAKANNIPVIFLSHRARHTIATFMNNAGADDVSITGIIGHSDVAFTKRQYANKQTTQLKRGMECFSDFVAHIPA